MKGERCLAGTCAHGDQKEWHLPHRERTQRMDAEHSLSLRVFTRLDSGSFSTTLEGGERHICHSSYYRCASSRKAADLVPGLASQLVWTLRRAFQETID